MMPATVALRRLVRPFEHRCVERRVPRCSKRTAGAATAAARGTASPRQGVTTMARDEKAEVTGFGRTVVGGEVTITTSDQPVRERSTNAERGTAWLLSLLNSERGETSPPFSCRSVSTAWKPSVGSGGMPSLPDIPEQQADERAGQRPGGSAAGFNQRRQVAAVWVRMGRRSRGLSSLRARSGQAQRHERRLFLPSEGVCSWDQGEAPAAALRLPEAAARSHC
jgi:hypothetical protein